VSPLPPPAPVAPFDIWETALQLARTRLNDAIQSLGGEVLTDTNVFTQTMVIGAWRKFQTFLAQMGHSAFKNRCVLYNFPVYAATDPSVQTALSWTYYFDGVSFLYPPTVGLLPADCILPLKIWERMAAVGNNAVPFPDEPMGQALDGLPNRRPQAWNTCWEWRNNALYFPGSIYSMDMQIEYASFLPDPATVNGVPWYSTATPYAANQQIPLMRALSPLSLYIAAECSVGRADLDTATFKTEAEDETKQVFNLEAKQKQRATTSRRRFSEQIRPGYSRSF
jgi:hypothetical protein